MRNGKQKIKVVSSQFDWSDLGSFESVYDYLVSIGHTVDENGNMVLGLIIIPLL
jgi:mannose-1-phosphate guanylyltransferase